MKCTTKSLLTATAVASIFFAGCMLIAGGYESYPENNNGSVISGITSGNVSSGSNTGSTSGGNTSSKPGTTQSTATDTVYKFTPVNQYPPGKQSFGSFKFFQKTRFLLQQHHRCKCCKLCSPWKSYLGIQLGNRLRKIVNWSWKNP